MSFANVYPNGPFEPTNHFTFAVTGAGSSIANTNIHVSLNGSDVTSLVTLTGTSNSWVGSLPILSNTIYSALVVTATNGLGLGATLAPNFDTFSQSNYMWEAEDYDFNGGQFIDNPMPTADGTVTGTGLAPGTLETNSYYEYPGAVSFNSAQNGIDAYAVSDSGETFNYRLDFVGTQPATDFLRQKFITAQTQLGDPNIADFDVGYFNGGDWLNYTHNYPAGTYYIYARIAGGAGPFSGSFFSIVTNGWGTATQSTTVLGYFADPNAAGWQTYHWIEMVDTNNNPVAVQFTGGTNTLKFTSGNDVDVNYYMLVPALAPAGVTLSASRSGSQIDISFPSLSGQTYTVLYSASLTAPITWNTLAVIPGDGTVKSATDTISGAARFYQVVSQ